MRARPVPPLCPACNPCRSERVRPAGSTHRDCSQGRCAGWGLPYPPHCLSCAAGAAGAGQRACGVCASVVIEGTGGVFHCFSIACECLSDLQFLWRSVAGARWCFPGATAGRSALCRAVQRDRGGLAGRRYAVLWWARNGAGICCVVSLNVHGLGRAPVCQASRAVSRRLAQGRVLSFRKLAVVFLSSELNALCP